MIDTSNSEFLTRDQRLDIAKRAIHSVPFFTNLPFALTVGTAKINQYASKVRIDYDFFLTEMQGNFGEVFTATNTLFNLSVWTGNQESVYGFNSGTLLPTSNICTEARFNTNVASQTFDDRQFETFPYLIKAGDNVYANIQNTGSKSSGATAILALKGFQVLKNVFLSSRETEQINQSLDDPIRYEFFRFPVDTEGLKSYSIMNDMFPRLILGFGVTNNSPVKSVVSQSTIFIKDVSRQIQMMNIPIPVDFIAPRLTCLLDANLYLTPIEYYFQPFAKLVFDITNISPTDLTGYEFCILTRTI